jgi:cytochrome c553
MSGRTLLAAAAAAIALGAAQDALAKGNAAAGKAKAAQTCAACHGADGAKPSAPDQPILAGQHYDYLVKALIDYKTGKRNNAIMKGFAASLSKQDIEDLAAWFASQKSSLHFQR